MPALILPPSKLRNQHSQICRASCLRRQFETRSPRSVEEFVGGLVAPKRFRLRIPLERSTGQTRDVGQMADRDRPMSNFDVGDGGVARAQAVEPILHVPTGLPQRELIAPLSFFFRNIEFLV